MSVPQQPLYDRSGAMTLWTPAQATTLPRVPVPIGDLYLNDGRVLRDHSARDDQRLWRGPQRLAVIASLDPTVHGRLLHVSLSYPARDPSWVARRAVRDAFFPDSVDVMMVLPRAQDYVKKHPHTFHLWQTPVGWGIR